MYYFAFQENVVDHELQFCIARDVYCVWTLNNLVDNAVSYFRVTRSQ